MHDRGEAWRRHRRMKAGSIQGRSAAEGHLRARLVMDERVGMCEEEGREHVTECVRDVQSFCELGNLAYTLAREKTEKEKESH